MLDRILEDFLESNPKKEAILRAILSTSESKDSEFQQGLAVNSIMSELLAKFSPILDLLQKTSAFENDLAKFVHNAIHTWKDAQKSDVRTVANIQTTAGGPPWGERPEHAPEENAKQTSSEIQPHAITALFPQIYQISLTGKREDLHIGFALWSDHTIYRQGVKEYQLQSKRNMDVSGRVRRIRWIKENCTNITSACFEAARSIHY
jgi:hypothetical protein